MRGGCVKKKHGGQASQALGRSCGGFSTKIHIAVDALGNPLRLLLTGGESHDSTQAASLVEGLPAQAVIADKGYDSDDFIESVTATQSASRDSTTQESKRATRLRQTLVP